MVKNTVGKHGHLLIAPSHIREPEVPWENVEAFIAAAKKRFLLNRDTCRHTITV